MQTKNTRLILCAEDDPDDKELFCETAEKIEPEVKVIHAANGELLLEKLKTYTDNNVFPCLITLDINMPVLGGRETLMEIKKNPAWATIPVAIYTTSPKHLYTDLELQYGAVVITKPDRLEHIIDKVKELLSYCLPKLTT